MQSRFMRGYFWLIKHTVNRAALRMARRGAGSISLLRHVGRRTGRVYETPLIVARQPDGLVIELTYGPEVDWYRNITASGECQIRHRGVDYQIDRIHPLPAQEAIPAFGFPTRSILRLLRRNEFRLLHIASPLGPPGQNG